MIIELECNQGLVDKFRAVEAAEIILEKHKDSDYRHRKQLLGLLSTAHQYLGAHLAYAIKDQEIELMIRPFSCALVRKCIL